MVMDTRRLRAAIFERSGIAIDEHDPIMAVVAACAQQTEEIGALLLSEQGRAGVRLAELGVAALLANCTGRRSWRVQDGYCIPITSQGLPDGFRVPESGTSHDEGT